MITIKGTAKKIPKGNYKCPNDGIHRRKKSGRIRGFWALKIANTHICYGNWAYYFNGYKVFFSFKFNQTTKNIEQVRQTINIMEMLEGFCPKVHMIDEVKTDIRIDSRHFRATSPTIYMEHVHYPEKAWIKFAKGKPYDWKADDHPDHSKDGFIDFRSRLENKIENIDYNFDSLSIGNIVWCTEKKRWFLVDVR